MSSPATAPALTASRGASAVDPAPALAVPGATEGEAPVSQGFASLLATELTAASVSGEVPALPVALPDALPEATPAAEVAGKEAATRQEGGKILPDAGKAVAALLAAAAPAAAEPDTNDKEAPVEGEPAENADPAPKAPVATLAALPQVPLATAPVVTSAADAPASRRAAMPLVAEARADKPADANKSAASPARTEGPAAQVAAERPVATAAIPAAPREAIDAATLLQQPIVALRDAGTAGQALAVPTTAPAPSAPAGHDFAALVDRLVEARDMAGTRVVQAAVAHAEFGQVSMRFEQLDGGLSVSLASPDPDFARAVQAAAPAQAQAGTGDAPSRNDGQQGGAQGGSGQPQADARSQAQQHAHQHANQGRALGHEIAPGQQRDRDDQPETTEPQARRRGGIFA